jgi:hypothetical protein
LDTLWIYPAPKKFSRSTATITEKVSPAMSRAWRHERHQKASRHTEPSTGGGGIPPVIILQDGVDLLPMNGALGIRHLFVLRALPTVRTDHVLAYKDPASTSSFFVFALLTL